MRVMLEQIRAGRNLEEIADALGVAISTVQRWEKHSMSIPSTRLEEIAAAYGCSVKDIFSDDAPLSGGAEIVDIYTRIPAERRAEAKGILEIMAGKR